jgi:hypothetical protein
MCQKWLCFLSFIKSSLFACGVFQDIDNMLTQCTIVYYSIYLHTDDMKSREEAEEKKKKYMFGEISIFETGVHIRQFPNMERGRACACCAQRAVRGKRACTSQDGGHNNDMSIVRLRSTRRRCRHVAVARARWASGDDDAVAILWLQSLCREREGYAGEGRPGRGGCVVTATPWRSCGHNHHVVVVATSLLRA